MNSLVGSILLISLGLYLSTFDQFKPVTLQLASTVEVIASSVIAAVESFNE